MRRLLLARSAVAAALVALPLVGLAVPAAAEAPMATGWWNVATRDGAPQPPAPPDVAEGDLLVQSGDPSGLTVGSTEGSPTPSAVAALRFTVPAGSTVGAMTFEVAAGATASDVRAYATTDAWAPVLNGPLASAPAPDRSRFSQGVLDGSTLVFADIGRLLPESGELSVVLLPGTVDRVVLRKPGPETLAVLAGPLGPGADAVPTFGPAATDAGGAPAFGSSGSIDVAPGTAFAPGLADPPPLGVAVLPEVAAAPQVAAPSVAATPAPAALPAAGPVALSVLDDSRTRYLAAAEAVLVLITFGLFGWGPFARLSTFVGSGSPSDGPDERVRGVGRFAKLREGQVVRL